MIVGRATFLLALPLLLACPPPKALPPDAGDGPRADRQAASEGALVDAPREGLAADRPRADAPRADAPRADGPRADGPRPDASAPKGDSPLAPDGQGGCAATSCFIAGSCLVKGAVDTANACRVCDPGFNRYLWAPKQDCTITLAGSGVQGLADGPAYSAQLQDPNDLAVDPTGTVFIADAGAHLIRAISGGSLVTVAGERPPPGGQPLSGYKEGAAASARFNTPLDVAVDGAGTILVADSYNHAIRSISGGMVSTIAGGQPGSNDGQALLAGFGLTHGLARDSTGTLHVVEMDSCLVRKLSGGMVSTVAGQAAACGFADGSTSALSAKLNLPHDLVADGAGNVYIADTHNHLIRKLANGQLVLVAGKLVSGQPQKGTTDGAALGAALTEPKGLALDPARQRLYFTNENCVRFVDLAKSTVSTLNGTCAYGDVDGLMLKAQFSSLASLTTDGGGRVYLVDNRKVKVYQP